MYSKVFEGTGCRISTHTHTEIHAQRVTAEGSWASWKNPDENCFNLNKFMSSSAIEEDGRDDGVRSRDVT